MKVAYVLHGDFKLLSRVKRQIKALSKANFDIDLYDGIFSQNKIFNSEKSNIRFFLIKQTKSPLLNFYFLIEFNLRVSFAIIRIKSYKIIICRELSTLLSGFLVKFFNSKVKLIYDSNELSVELHRGFKKKIWKFLEGIFIKKCDLIIHAEENRLTFFNILYPNLNINQIVQPNYVEYSPNLFNKKINNNIINAIYFGGIGPHRNLEELIKVFSEFSNINLTLMGFGDQYFIDKLKKIIHQYNAEDKISFAEPIDDSKINESFVNYHIGIAFYPNTNFNNWYCAPNKVYQYIQNNMTVLTTNNPPLVDLIQKYKIGAYVNEVTTEEIKIALEKIISGKLWLNIREDIKRELSWENLEKTFTNEIKKLVCVE